MVYVILALVFVVSFVAGLLLFRRIRDLEELVALQALDRKRLESKVEDSVKGLELDAAGNYQRVVESFEILDKDCARTTGILAKHKADIQGNKKAIQDLSGSHKELAQNHHELLQGHNGLRGKHGDLDQFVRGLDEQTNKKFQETMARISLLFGEVSQRVECIGNLREQVDALEGGYARLGENIEDEIQVRGLYSDSFRAIIQHLQGVWEIYCKVQSRLGEHEGLIGKVVSKHDETDVGIERIHALIRGLDEKDATVSDEIRDLESKVSGLRDSDVKILETLGLYRTELDKHDSQMSIQSEQAKGLEGLIGEVSSRVELFPKSVKTIQDEVTSLATTLGQLRDFTQVQGQCINDLTTGLSDLRQGSEVFAKESESMQGTLEELGENTVKLQEEIERCSQSLKECSNEVSMVAYADALSRSGLAMPTMSYDDLDIKKLSWINSTVRRKPNLNSIVFQSKPRLMTANDYKTIEDKWLPPLGIEDLNRSGLSYMAHRICNVELMTHGRYATSIQDALLRLVVLRSFQGKEPVAMLEIGTLFGLNIACAWDLSSVLQVEFSATVIDPLDGYYKDGKNDTATSLPVNDFIFWQNLEQVGCPRDRVNLIQGKSQEQFVQDRVSGFQFNYLLIDGDHSYEGVQNDFERFTPFLKPGGFLLVDDYSSNEWPDVTKFVDEVIRKDSGFEFVISEWRTALFRKV